MRAVSSPSLTDNPLDNLQQTTFKTTTIEQPKDLLNDTPPINSTCSGGVLQRLKNTLTNLKSSKSATTGTSPAVIPVKTSDASNRYRLGNLVWRTSKDRKKTYYPNNSGDSGIQVEGSAADRMNTEDPSVLPVRRANSAKETSLIIHRRTPPARERSPVPLAKRSYSQPYGLDALDKSKI